MNWYLLEFDILVDCWEDNSSVFGVESWFFGHRELAINVETLH